MVPDEPKPEPDNDGYPPEVEPPTPEQAYQRPDNYGYDPARAEQRATSRPQFPAYESPVPGYDNYDTYGAMPAYDGPRGAYRPVGERRAIPGYVKLIGGCLVLCTLLLLVCGIAAGVVAALAFTSTPATSSFAKTLTVSGTPNVVIHGETGTIRVVPGAAGTVQVQGTTTVRNISHDQAQQELDSTQITATQTGNTVLVEVHQTSFNGFDFGFHSRKIDLTVTVPAASNLNVIQSAGNLDANGITGKLVADVSAGSVTLTDMSLADGSRLSASAGSVSLNGQLQPGASMSVDVSAGTVTMNLPRDTNTHLDASASAGNVSVNGWDVSTTHNAANTTVTGDLGSNPSGTLTIQVSAGSVTLNAD